MTALEQLKAAQAQAASNITVADVPIGSFTGTILRASPRTAKTGTFGVNLTVDVGEHGEQYVSMYAGKDGNMDVVFDKLDAVVGDDSWVAEYRETREFTFLVGKQLDVHAKRDPEAVDRGFVSWDMDWAGATRTSDAQHDAITAALDARKAS